MRLCQCQCQCWSLDSKEARGRASWLPKSAKDTGAEVAHKMESGTEPPFFLILQCKRVDGHPQALMDLDDDPWCSRGLRDTQEQMLSIHRTPAVAPPTDFPNYSSFLPPLHRVDPRRHPLGVPRARGDISGICYNTIQRHSMLTVHAS